MIHIPAPWGLTLSLATLFALPVAVLVVPPVAAWLRRRRLPWVR